MQRVGVMPMQVAETQTSRLGKPLEPLGERPMKLSRLITRATTVTAAIVIGTAAPALACVDSNTQGLGSAAAPAEAVRMLDMVNAERASAGMGALSSDLAATAIAQGQALAMATAGSIWHNEAYFTSAVHATLNASVLSENVACNWGLEQAHQALMESPGHRANILDARLTGIGIGVHIRTDGAYYVVQNLFAGKGAQVASTSVTAAPPATPTAPTTGAPRVQTAASVTPRITTPHVATSQATAPAPAAPQVVTPTAAAPAPAVTAAPNAAITEPAPSVEDVAGAPLVADGDAEGGMLLAGLSIFALLDVMAAAACAAVVTVRRRR